MEIGEGRKVGSRCTEATLLGTRHHITSGGITGRLSPTKNPSDPLGERQETPRVTTNSSNDRRRFSSGTKSSYLYLSECPELFIAQPKLLKITITKKRYHGEGMGG